MSKSNLKIILALLAIAMLAGSYLYLCKPNLEDKKSVESEINTLQARYDDLKSKESQRETLEKETAEFNEQFESVLNYYPAGLNQDVSVMFMAGVEDALEFEVNSVGLGAESQFYTLGSGAVAAGAAETEVSPDDYTCYTAAFPISYQGSYEGIKDFMSYIMNYYSRMNISSVNISYDAEADMCTGSVQMNMYCIKGGDRDPETTNIDMPTGVDNLFLGGAGAPSATTYAYDADNGESLAANHDMVIMLNNANGDGAAGVIAATDNGDEASYVSSAENEVAKLSIKVYSEDDKNYVEYSIGDESYVTEITSTDLKIYVASSKRVDSDDVNGVEVTVDNTTSLPVFFKVADDDAASPRFSIAKKSGTVKVY